jgi:hypothetical protein
MKIFWNLVGVAVFMTVLTICGVMFFTPSYRQHDIDPNPYVASIVIEAQSEKALQARIAQMQREGWTLWDTYKEERMTLYPYRARMFTS